MPKRFHDVIDILALCAWLVLIINRFYPMDKIIIYIIGINLIIRLIQHIRKL